MIDPTMNRFRKIPTLIVIVLVSGQGAVAQVQVTEDFSVDPSNWTGHANFVPFFGTSFGYSATNNTGGTFGEAGGQLPERIDGIVAYYADTSVATHGRLTDLDTLYASGSFTLGTNTNAADGGFYIGWLTTTSNNSVDPRRIGINFNARDVGQGPYYWWRPNARYERWDTGLLSSYNSPDSNSWRDDPIHADAYIVPGETYDFEISFDPGSRILSVTLSGLATRTVVLPDGDDDTFRTITGLNAFGIFTNWSNRNEPSSLFYPFINDLEYTSNAFAPPTIDGDFNGDGFVDAADYVYWRKGLGGDYNVWRANFGAAGSGSGAALHATGMAVPEPQSWLLMLSGLMVAAAAMLRRSARPLMAVARASVLGTRS